MLFRSDDMFVSNGVGWLNSDQNVVVQNFTAPDSNIYIKLKRDVAESEVDYNRNLPSIPGFSVKWSYNQDIKPDSRYGDNQKNIEFKR